MSFNKVIVVGNLGRDPELRFTPQGTAVCSFTVATNERRKDTAGEMQDVTTWVRVTVWGRQAENVSKYLSKGRSVYVEGRLHVSEWTDKEGKPRHTLEVNAQDVQFIDSGERVEGIPVRDLEGGRAPSAARAAAGGGGSTGRLPARPAPDEEDDSIPF
ncbi:MAG TPA: single-stranded DNA-binding protein [Pyrinomonadaceae bacterium]|nr:single-stranded DNA-binding protein [Pyrinomonadaceae bacterium]